MVLPMNLEELLIPDRYTVTTNVSPFLLFDSGPEPNRMLIFSIRNNMRLLSQSRHWYADGTFKVVPQLFGQLYTVHGIM